MKAKRLFAILLTLAMVLTYMPALAFADVETAGDPGTPAAEELQTEVPEAETEPQTDAVTDSVDMNPEQVLEQEKAEAVNGQADDPAVIPEDDPDETEPAENTGTVSGSVNVDSSVDLADSDELLMEYLEKGMPQKAPAATKLRKAASATRGDRLEGNNKLIYGALKDIIIDLTEDDGVGTSTVFGIDVNRLPLDKTTYTKADLGVDTLVEGESLTNAATDALFEQMGVDKTGILDALLCDMPYYLYWFDKTTTTGGMYLGLDNISIETEGEEVTALIVNEAELTFSFTVAGEYRDSKAEHPEFTVNVAKIAAANTAKATAGEIITQNAENSDIEKLTNYRDEICRLTSYDDAAGKNQVPYGDPWQMISVFDNNAATEVVCEGYSKAFQFLCDNSDFDSDIECDSVTGSMTGGTGAGLHMWNILHMNDGKNYIADITNCDKGTIGSADENGGPYLFLNGCKPEGSVANGYHYSCQDNEDLFYTYDEDTIRTFSTEELTMSENDYEDNQGGNYYHFEFAGEEGMPERLYSDGTIQFKLPEEAVIPAGAKMDIRIGINTGNPEEGEHGWIVDFAYGGEYTFNDRTMTLTLDGSEVYKKIGDEYDYISFFAGVQEGDYDEGHFDGWIADGGCEYRVARAEYDMEHDRDMLPGWDGGVGGHYGVWLDNAEYPEYDGHYKVTDVEVTAGEDLLQDFHRDQNEDDPDDYWWYYRIKDSFELDGARGTVTFKVTYEDLDEQEQTYTFNVNVCNDVYEVWLNSVSGSDRGLPGSSIELKAEGIHKYLDEDEEYQETSEGLSYDWEITNGGEFATISPDSNDPSEATLTFNELPEGQESIWEDVEVKVSLKADNEEKAQDQRNFCVGDDYCEIWPLQHNDELDMYESETLNCELRNYRLGQSGFTVIDETDDVTYEFFGDDHVTAVQDPEDGSKFTITRNREDDIEFEIRATWGDGNEENAHYHYKFKNYDIWFEHDGNTVYTDSTMTYTLNTDNLGEDWASKYDIDFTAGQGEWNDDQMVWNKKFTVGKEYTVNGNAVTFIGAALTDYLNDGFVVLAELKLKGTDKVLSTEDNWCEVRESFEDNNFPMEHMNVLRGDTFPVDPFIDYFRQNADYPYGKPGQYKVLNVTHADTASEAFTTIEKKTEGENVWWDIHAEKTGVSNIKITYKDAYETDTEHTYTFALVITDDTYEVRLDSLSGEFAVLPGGSIPLKAYAVHRSATDSENGEWIEYDETEEGFSIIWEIEDDEGDVVKSLEADPADQSKAVLTFKTREENSGEDPEGRARVRVKVFDSNNDEVASAFDYYAVNTEFGQIIPKVLSDPDMDCNETEHLSMKTVWKELGKEDRVIPNVTYVWGFNEGDFQLKDGEGNEIHSDEPTQATEVYITRKTIGYSRLVVRAEWGMNQFKWHAYYVNPKHYSIVLDEDVENDPLMFAGTPKTFKFITSGFNKGAYEFVPGISTMVNDELTDVTAAGDITDYHMDGNNLLVTVDPDKLLARNIDRFNISLIVKKGDTSIWAENGRPIQILTQEKIEEGVADAEAKAREAETEAQKAAAAVETLKQAADAAKEAADKAASSLTDEDIAAAQQAAADAQKAKSAAETAIQAAKAAKDLANEAITQVSRALEEAETAGVDTGDKADRVNAAKEKADNVNDAIAAAAAAKSTADAVVADASKKADKAASDKAAADKAAADKAAADKAAAEKAAAAKAAAEKAEADRKAAEFAANGYGYIDPTLPKVKIQKPKAAKKSFTAKWKKIKNKKQLKKIKGIEVEYSLTSDFQNPLFKSASKKKANVKIKKLLSKKTYYVRAHTYVIKNGVKYVSYWSATKKVKVK